MKYRGLLLAASMFFCTALIAQDADDEFEAVPEPPDLPDPLVSGEPIEPEVTIIRTEKEVVEEYRINGNLYQIKVIPVVGPAYYMVDMDGDGRLESQKSGIYDSGQVPKWVIFSW